eukprot:CAMPEP_0172299184 /NCGR_PEP_ID=MMETSP1058-20130122/1550_1 /TAXON_ID=83371 /ORGANISM="Detonula confervacea, Strain CCMP 353" /LENGTH=115 /DNA_ID=CAMNT_0013008543 /DNA_START=483 /DNA_END=827 /DNA_ORIENTATION=-
MAFPVQPSKKRKKNFGRRRKIGSSYASHQASLAAMASNPAEQDLEAAVETVSDASSHSAPKKRKDDNWRVSRAVKSAQNQAAKALSARDLAREEDLASKAEVRVAEAILRLKQGW